MKVEGNTTAMLERSYMKEERGVIYTALEELDFHWSERDVRIFDALWREGKSLIAIAEYFNRDLDETALLLMDRARLKTINQRKNGIWKSEGEKK
ncbi:helix-turn-helix domain-containing protein [Bacillus taeanensis]|uniref:Helix-turn-helix domain-containing protein n=1 Tax=Bacillus taeanensis TaxID=273032 RepID=A0A366XT63_9BACI|nr:helix-turn-helix domain-containing protein [Bacillus taeanensis]RBW68856.1 helix-turn-helix domain-containing protein [Bacillus taeanensis]